MLNNASPGYIHALIPRTCGCDLTWLKIVGLVFADVIQLRTLRWEIILNYLGGP